MWLESDCIVVEELALASFRFTGLLVALYFRPRAPGRPRLGDLGVPSLGDS